MALQAQDAARSGESMPAEHRWPVVVAIAVALVLFGLVDPSLHVVPKWIVVGIVVVGVLPLIVLNPHRLTRETRWSRRIGIGVAVAFAIAAQVNVVIIVLALVEGGLVGTTVLLNAGAVWIVQVIVFALIFWELDGGGPVARRVEGSRDRFPRHFRFPQQEGGEETADRWQPAFVDYAYVALTNMVAFSPADTMPLTHTAKLLMGWQAVTGFTMLALVIARAVSIIA